MSNDQIVGALEEARELLSSGGSEDDYNSGLVNLASAIKATSQPEIASELANDASTVDICVDVITNSLLLNFQSPIEEQLYVRLLRGVVLFLRNLVAYSQTVIDLPLLLLNIQHFTSKIHNENPFFYRCLASYMEVLANIVLKQGSDFSCNFVLVTHTFDSSFLTKIDKADDQSVIVPFLTFINGALQKDHNTATLLKDANSAPLMSFLLEKGARLETECELQLDGLILEIFQKIVINQAFENWLVSQEASTDFRSTLRICQLASTSKDDWSNQDCTTMMSWSFELTKNYSAQAVQLLNSPESNQNSLDRVHQVLVKSLDIISDLSKFNSAQQFLEHYNALEVLIPLLRAVQDNTEVKGLKKKVEAVEDEQAAKKSFPLVKSLVIEILAFMCHDSKTIQNKIRELHGLELVLSNCIIDDDNPFLKERSILCLKFLLSGNSENQAFVESLEAKQVVNDDALREAGYEVDIVDGNVKLKKST